MEIDAWKFLAGLMLFLLAMKLVEEAIQALVGRRFKTLIANNTRSPPRAVLSGAVATAVLQSSSMVSLMMLAFVGARVIRMRDALLVVFGANLGTTATGWIVATIGFKLDLEAAALPLIAVGGLYATLMARRRTEDAGRFALGVGLLLLSLQFMKSAVQDVATLADPDLLAGFSGAQFLLFGALFSAVVQSSSATMVITLSLLNAGMIDLPSSAALMIGADLGTTSTVMLGAIGGTANKKRLALGHFLFNLLTDGIAFVIRSPLLWMVAFVGDPLLILVAFHSAFNLMGLMIWTPLIGQFAGFLERRFVAADTKVSRFLEDTARAVPETALQTLRQEILHLLDRVVVQNGDALDLPRTRPVPDVAPAFSDAYRATKALEGEVLRYALDLERSGFSERENDEISGLLHATRDALLASKELKDVLGDLDEVAAEHPPLHRRLLGAYQELYRRIAEFGADPVALTATQLEGWSLDLDASHHRCHEAIYQAIKSGDLPESRMSSVLNINRSLFNSSRALLSSIGDLSGIVAAADSTAEESLPRRTG